jgi:hypothetical protein
VVHAKSAGPPTATAPFRGRGRQPPSGRYGPRGGGSMTPRGPQGSGCPTGPAIPSGSPASLPGQRVHDVGIDRPHQVVPPCAEVVAWPARFGPPSSRSAEADSGRPRPGALRLPARPAAARAGPAGHPGLAGRRGGSPLWLGVPGALSRNGRRRHRGPGPPGHRPHRGRRQPAGRHGHLGRVRSS